MSTLNPGDFHRLVVRHLAGENSLADEQVLKEYLKDPGNRAVYAELTAAWHQADARPRTEFNVDNAVASLRRELAVEKQIETDRRELAEKSPGAPFAFWRRGVWGTAAAALVVVALSLVWSQRLPAKNVWSEQHTNAGERRDIVLPDGTEVELNAQSTLRFPSVFSGSERRVTLSGEGFFKVASAGQKSFVVETPAMVVTARNSQFNLSAYGGEEGSTVVVVRGDLEVKPAAPTPAIRVGEAQSYRLADEARAAPMGIVDHESALDWRENRLVFKNATMQGVAKKLTRKFGVPVELASTFPPDLKLTAQFTTESLEEICAALEATGAVDFRIERSVDRLTRVMFFPPAR